MSPERFERSAIRAMSTGVVMVAVMALVGHAANISWMYHYYGVIGMSFNASICLLLTGMSLLLLTRGEK